MDKGIYDKYTVINNHTGDKVEDCFVLKPSTDKNAIKALREYANLNKNSLIGSELNEWLNGFDKHRCKYNRYCSIINSMMCCAHCKYLDLCLEQNPNMCNLVYSNDVIDLNECNGE